jgi:hypothetical protein
MKISEHFDIREFVPPSLWNEKKEKCIEYIDPAIISIAEFYRDFFKSKVIVNDWLFGGQLTLRGWRPQDCKIGAKFSQHKLGKAFDCHFDTISHIDAYKKILADPKPFMEKGLTTLENIEFTKTWLHSDVRKTGYKGILIVNP